MTDRERSFAPVCLSCGQPLPEARAKTRRYCSASCRTSAYNLRVAERLAPRRATLAAELPPWVSTPSGEVPLLSQTRATLNEVGATLDALAHRIEAEESALRRDLDRVRARVSKQQALERELAQARQHCAERDAEVRQLRQQLAERPAQSAPTKEEGRSSTTLSTYGRLRVPDRLLDGLAHLTRQLDFVRCFARAQAQRAGSEVLTGFAQGLALIHAHLSTPTTDLATLLGHDDAAIPPAALRWALLQDILPAFDDLYRCVRTLRSSPQSPLLVPLHEVVEWVFANFVEVLLRRHEISLLYPLGTPFDPHEDDACALVQNARLLPGTIAEVLQVGVRFDGTLLRPARVTVVAERPSASSS